jgi:hypothetical protein
MRLSPLSPRARKRARARLSIPPSFRRCLWRRPTSNPAASLSRVCVQRSPARPAPPGSCCGRGARWHSPSPHLPALAPARKNESPRGVPFGTPTSLRLPIQEGERFLATVCSAQERHVVFRGKPARPLEYAYEAKFLSANPIDCAAEAGNIDGADPHSALQRLTSSLHRSFSEASLRAWTQAPWQGGDGSPH